MMLPLPLFYLLVAAFEFASAQSQFVGGWASREINGCASGEVSCGTRGPRFSACCPRGTVCMNSLSSGFTDNTGCCPTGADCSDLLAQANVCADNNWRLYNNSGPFCCLAGFSGGIASGGSDVCRNGAFESGETVLALETPGSRQISVTTSAPPSTSSTASATAPPRETNTPASSTKLSSGAIAGIAIGAIAGLVLIGLAAWLIGRRAGMRRSREQKALLHPHDFSNPKLGGISSNYDPPSATNIRNTYTPPPPVYNYDREEMQELAAPIPSPPPAPVVYELSPAAYGQPATHGPSTHVHELATT
ncbi:hypothetical protein ABW20_dc0109521 [Dactylellina cionopaga]|nr:hypothetical protein ABW20_dc0109521 [Dactylellina cionopaga]